MANLTNLAFSGGSSVSGISVSCYSSMENCLEACYMSCYVAEHCNDSAEAMVACAPGLFMMIVLTVLFVLFLCCCCCAICFLSPCCVCAIWYKKRRDNRNRAAGERTIPQPTASYPSAPPLLQKV